VSASWKIAQAYDGSGGIGDKKPVEGAESGSTTLKITKPEARPKPKLKQQ